MGDSIPAIARGRCRRALLCLLPNLLIAPPLLAEDTDATSADALEEVVVLGSRTPLPKGALAGLETRFGARDLEAARLPFVADLLRTAPTASVSRTGGFGGLTQLRVRGAEANQTLVLLDGFELNDPANGSEFDLAHLRATTVDAVELLPGPGGALWGSDALAGALALRAPRARRDGLDAGLRLAGADHGTAEGTVRLGFRDDRVDAGLVLDRFETDGENVALAGDERDGYEIDTLALSAGVALSDQLSLRTTLRHVDAQTEFDPSPFPAFVPADGDRRTDLERTLVGLRADYAAANGWRHALGAESLSSSYDDRADGARTSGREGERRRLFVQSSLDYVAGLPGTQRLTLLGEVEREEFEQDGTASPFGDPNQDQSITHQALLAEWRWSNDDGFHAFAAARHDWNDAFRDAWHLRLGARAALPAGAGDLWASWASGTKNPGFVERFGFTPDTFVGNPDLRPERSRALEIGWSRSFGDGTVTTDLLWHRTRLEDEIDGFAFDPVANGFTAANRDRNSHREGIEARVTVGDPRASSVTLRYAFLDASEPDATGRVREIRRPRNAAGLNGTWAPSRLPLTLRADLSWVGERTDRDFATFPATVVDLDDFVTVDVAANWRVAAGLELFVRAENLFAEDYTEVFGYDAPGQTLRAGFEYRMR